MAGFGRSRFRNDARVDSLNRMRTGGWLGNRVTKSGPLPRLSGSRPDPVVQKLLDDVRAFGLGLQQSDEHVLGTDGTKAIRDLSKALRIGPKGYLVVGCMKQQEVLVRIHVHFVSPQDQGVSASNG